MLAAEKRVIPAHTHPWNPSIHEEFQKVVRNTARIKKMHNSGMKEEVI